MVCGGFTCSKNSLVVLNVLYIIVAIILIAVPAYLRFAAYITSLGLVGSLIACGVFLFMIAIIGLVGAVKHHQVLLFFYMIILFLLFLIQFSLACACLAVNKSQEVALLSKAWSVSDASLKSSAQFRLDCCGFEDQTKNNSSPDGMGHPSCADLDCCKSNPTAPCCGGPVPNNTVSEESCPCSTCLAKIESQIHNAFSVTGGVGLFFSFTEIIGVWLAMRYRNQKDPRANPSAFL